MSAADELKALGPKRAVVNGNQVDTHSIQDLIAYEKYAKKRDNPVNPFMRIKRAKFVLPGAVSNKVAPDCQ